MALTSSFFEAVNNRDIRMIRIMMKDSLLVDPSFTDFNAMEKAVSSFAGSIYQKHDGELFKDKSLWNDSYMNSLLNNLMFNFSRERLNHAKDVVSYLRPNFPAKKAPENNTPQHNNNKTLSYQEQKRIDQKEGNFRGFKIAAGGAVCGVVGGVVAAACDGPVIPVAAACAAAGSVALALITREDK